MEKTDMELQEREIELKYLDKIIERLQERGDAIYKASPSYKFSQYAWESSSNGTYDPLVEARLEQESNKWKTTDEAKAYSALVERLSKMLSLRTGLIEKQEMHVLEKYNL